MELSTTMQAISAVWKKAMKYLGQDVCITRDRDTLLRADKVILPGVGSFGDAMNHLQEYGLVDVIHELTELEKPFLGICLGLQLLFERSEESPGVEGLGILKGEILKIPETEGLKIPHMGWNSLTFQNQGRLFKWSGRASVCLFCTLLLSES